MQWNSLKILYFATCIYTGCKNKVFDLSFYTLKLQKWTKKWKKLYN